MTWTIEKWDYSVDSPARQEMLKRMQQMTVVAINYEKDTCIFLGDDNAETQAEAKVVVEALNGMHAEKMNPVAWRTRDLSGDGWVVFATEEKGLLWIKNNAPTRSHNSLHPLYESPNNTANHVEAGVLADVIFEASTGDANWYDAKDAADAVLARYDLIEKVKP